jgi:hypothetical protein
VYDCALHSTFAVIRVQRSPQRKSRAMNPAFSLCAALLSHQPRAKSNVSFRQQRQSDTLKNASIWRAERTQLIDFSKRNEKLRHLI